MTSVAEPMRALAALVVLFVGAPVVPGVIGRVKAIAAGRRGAPVWQLYADLAKLLRRGSVYSTTTTWIFRVAPVALVATAALAATLLPLDGGASLVRFPGDAVAFVYLLALGRFILVLAALDTGSSFEGMGASREVTFAALVEPGLFVSLVALGLMAHDFSLTAMLGTAHAGGVAAAAPSVMIAVSLVALALAECARVPVDDPATHLELTMIHEVMVLDHGGPDLALILYANALKLGIFAALIAGVLIPFAWMAGWVGLAWLAASLVLLGVVVGSVEATMARLRLPKVPLYIVSSSALALFGLVLLLR